MKLKRRRRATEKEMSTSLKVITYRVFDNYLKKLERISLKTRGHSTAWGSMTTPVGLIKEYRVDDKTILIHACWKKVLKDAYVEEVNPIMV